MNDDAEELNEYAELSNDEFGEMCTALINLSRRSGLSDELQQLIDKEISDNLVWCKEHLKIVESIKTYTHTVRELVEA